MGTPPIPLLLALCLAIPGVALTALVYNAFRRGADRHIDCLFYGAMIGGPQ
jgi:hypothetical protein